MRDSHKEWASGFGDPRERATAYIPSHEIDVSPIVSRLAHGFLNIRIAVMVASAYRAGKWRLR